MLRTLGLLITISTATCVAQSSRDLQRGERWNLKQCPSDFQDLLPFGCYKILNQVADWETAKKTCNRNGGSHLISIETDTEMSFIQNLLSGTNSEFWTGGNDHGQGGAWTWEEGNKKMVYTNWLPGRPLGDFAVDSTLLTDESLSQLQRWLPNKAFSLLYRSSRDGMTGQAFHSRVNYKGPTISIGVDASTGILYGGYTGEDWTENSYNQGPDPHAFIFRICKTKGCSTITSKVKWSGAQATNSFAHMGPVFGLNDFVLFSSGTKGRCHPHGLLYVNSLKCGNNITWSDVEVFAVKDSPNGVQVAVAGYCMALKTGSREWVDKKCSEKRAFVCEKHSWQNSQWLIKTV